MINKTPMKPSHSLSVALALVAITALMPSRVEALGIDVATPEFLRGETRPKSVALLPPQGLNQEFETHARDQLASLLTRKGYARKVLTVEQVNADPQLQELALRTNQRFDEELGVLLRIKWLGKRKKKVSQRQVNLGAEASLLASKLDVDAVAFARVTFTKFTTGFGTSHILAIHLGVVNGATGDLEAYYADQVQSWRSPRDGIHNLTQKLRDNFPSATHVIKAKGSTLKTSAKSAKDKDATVKELETLLGNEDPSEKAVTTARPSGTTTTTRPNAAPPSMTVAKAATLAATLCEAAKRGDLTSASKLLAEGADVNAQCRPLSMGLPAGLATPLHVASFNDAPGVAKLLLDHGADVNVKNKNGRTPLHVAAATGSADLATLLLARSAGVNIQDQLGRTPLHDAVFKGNADVVRLLLAHGAATNIEDDYGMTPKRLATDPQVVELFR